MVAVFDDGRVTLERLELADRSPGEVDVAISAAAVCGSDLHTVLGHRSTPPRTALGHEGVGRVIDADSGAVDFRGASLSPGDRVVFAIYSACGSCDRCASGLPMKCRNLFKYGHESVTRPPHASGTLATRVRLLPGVPVLRIPDDLTDNRVVSAGCAVATAAAIVRAAGSPTEKDVLVFGAGGVGTYCAAMLASMGNRVAVVDPAEQRLAFAEQMGARSRKGDEGPFPIVIEASGSAAAFENALEAADIGGRVVAAGSVSPGSTTVTFDPALVVTRRLTLIGIHNYAGEDLVWSVDWMEKHAARLGLERLVSAPLPLSQIGVAFDMMREGGHPRVLVVPEGE